MAIQKPKKSPLAKPDENTGNNYRAWFWAAEQKEKKHSAKWDRCVQKVKKSGTADKPEAVCTAQLGDKSYEADTAGDAGIDASADIQQLLVDNPNINASTFANLLKSKGFKIVREANQSTANVAVLRKESGKRVIEAMKLFSKHARAIKKREAKEIKYTTWRFMESGKDLANPTSANKFRVRLIQEGLGNLKDGFYYTKEALKSAVPVFEGKKMYADHPSADEEETRPERSVRDIVGHYENVEYKENEDGSGFLEADAVVLPDQNYQWVRSLMRHSVDYAKQFPDKDFIGLSINASGDAVPVNIQDFIKEAKVPESAKPKIEQAAQEGLTEVRLVNKIESAVSVDLVTEAGARGKIISLLEAEKNG